MANMYRFYLLIAGLLGSFFLILLALADVRRAFLGLPYFFESSWVSFSIYHFFAFIAGIVLVCQFYFMLGKAEEKIKDKIDLGKVAHVMLWSVFVLLVFDLVVFYRSVAMMRIANAGSMKSTVAGPIPATAELMAYSGFAYLKPVAMTVNYLAAVWHATIIGLLLASLSIVGFGKIISKKLVSASRIKSVTMGSLWALPQPFCSCCASPIAAGLIKSGSPVSSAISFLVASPMLNVTAIILAIMLLPLEYAVLRVGAGVLLAIPVSYLIAFIADKFNFTSPSSVDIKNPEPQFKGFLGLISRAFNRYCDLYSVERLVAGGITNKPSFAFKAFIKTFGRMAKLIVPMLIIGSLFASLVVTYLEPYIGNDITGILIAAAVGVLLMIATWTEIPVATVLASAGMTGPAAAFLVTLPAVSLPCLLILGGSLRNFKVAALLGFAVFLIGLAAGIIFI